MACVLRTLYKLRLLHVLSNQLSHIYKVNKEVFDRDDPDAIKRYFRMSKQFAFYNLTLLAKNGQDFLHAIANMRRQKDKGAGALYCCAQTGVMDSNALSCAEIRLEVNGFNDTLHANEILSKLLLLVLGNPDPFSVAMSGEIDELEISNRLECTIVAVPIKNNKVQQKLIISPAKSQELVALVVAFVSCNPRMFTPYAMPGLIASNLHFGITKLMPCTTKPGSGPLQFTKMMTILDGFVQVMYDANLKRKENPKRLSNNTYLHQYMLKETTDFTRIMPDNSHNQTKPPVPAWAAVNDLTDEDLMQIDGNVVQPSLEHAERQVGGLGQKPCNSLSLRDLPGLKRNSNIVLKRTPMTSNNQKQSVKDKQQQINDKKRQIPESYFNNSAERDQYLHPQKKAK